MRGCESVMILGGLTHSVGASSVLFDRPGVSDVKKLGSKTGASQVFFSKDKQDAPKAGFGKDTVSVRSAALHTIRRGVEGVRRIVPTPAESRALARARVIQRRREERRAQEARRANQIERRRPEPSALARNFVSTVNRAAATAEARLRGEEGPPDPNRPTANVQVNGENFSLNTIAVSGGQRIDIRT